MTWSASFTCRTAPTRSPRGAPIVYAIHASAKRRAIAPCPEHSPCVTKSAAREESATTFRGRKVCIRAPSNAQWERHEAEEVVERRTVLLLDRLERVTGTRD